MAIMQVKAAEKLLEELAEPNRTKLWNHMKEAKYYTLIDWYGLAGCTRQTGQRLMRKLVEYGIFDKQSSYWKTSEKWRDRWAHERANQEQEGYHDDPEETSEEPSPPPPNPKQPTKKQSEPHSIQEGSVAEMIRQAAEQEDGEGEPIQTVTDQKLQKPSPARKRGSNPGRQAFNSKHKSGRKKL